MLYYVHMRLKTLIMPVYIGRSIIDPISRCMHEFMNASFLHLRELANLLSLLSLSLSLEESTGAHFLKETWPFYKLDKNLEVLSRSSSSKPIVLHNTRTSNLEDVKFTLKKSRH